MANIKKISINAFEKAIGSTYVPTETITWNGLDITVKKTLSLQEMLNFVDNVVKSCFVKISNSYIPEIKDFAIKSCVLEKYANFTMPKNVQTRYQMIYQSDVFNQIVRVINPEQYNEILTAIDAKLSHIAQSNIEAVNVQMNELYNSFNSLQTKIEDIFSGVNGTDMQAMAGALANGLFDEKKLVDAYKDSLSDADGVNDGTN